MPSLNLWDHQLQTFDALREAFREGKRRILLYAPTGFGKCLGRDTPVMMADGRIKAVQDIRAGDKLLGPDGGIRNVLSTTSGIGQLYRVTPTKGDPYVVNDAHILSLKKTPGSDGINFADGSHIDKHSDIVNVNVKTFANSNKTARHCLKGWRVDPIEFDRKHTIHDISVDAIGDGEYYGFAIDGDKLFLLGDFTVTHNTEIAIALMQATEEKGNRSAMLLDRIALCNQTSSRLEKYSIDHGVLQSGHWRYRPDRKIQICSAQTLEKRGSFPGLNLLIVDEAHCIRKETKNFILNNDNIKTIGLSASPFTNGLSSVYDHVVSTVTTDWLVQNKFLSGLRVFISKEIDMEGAKKIAGEWSEKDASERGIKITGDIVSEWVKRTHEIFGRPRKTIVFSAGVAHGEDLSRKFAEAGYNFISISYKDDDEFKKQVIEDFSKPDTSIHGLIATDILTKGFDCPDVMISISARPFSKSFSSHVQQLGRVMRAHPDKEQSGAIWLCHSGNYLRFQEEWDDLYHNGVSGLKDGQEKPKKEKTAKEKEAAKCPRCSHLWPSKSDVCPNCGFERVKKNDIISLPGEMVELGTITAKEKADKNMKQLWYSMLLHKAKERGYAIGWVSHKYKEKFGVWPRGLSEIPTEPNVEVNNWLKSKAIAWAHRRNK